VEKTTLEGMIQARDELIMEMAEEFGLNHMGRMMMMRMRMTMTKGILPHPLHLCPLLPRLRRSSKRKPPWRWFLSKKTL
jgi:hypothetical protein